MRVTITARGDLEKHIQREIERTGMSAAMVVLSLAISGMEYKEGLKSFSVLAAALENMGDGKGGSENGEEVDGSGN